MENQNYEYEHPLTERDEEVIRRDFLNLQSKVQEQMDKIEEKKYYIPTIEEFHVGFECEIKNLSGNFIPFIHDKDSIGYMDTFRVPYLTNKDFIYNGFRLDLSKTKMWGNFQGEHWTKKFYIEYYPNGVKGEYNPLAKVKISEKIEQPGITIRSEVVFNGIIKNKSVLRNVLKMINCGN